MLFRSEARAAIGRAGVVIASRYHACVAALAQGVPCIATAWTHKYRALFAPFQMEYAVLEHGCSEHPERLIAQVIAYHGAREAERSAVRADLALQVERMWSEVLQLLGSTAG